MSYLGLGRELPRNLKALAQKIKLVVFDVDGVLTDGRLYYGGEGEVVKAFNVKDGVGIKLLRTQGIEVAVISAKSSMPLQKRITDLGIKHFYPGTKDKKIQLQQLCQKLQLLPGEAAFVGDDVIDLKVKETVGLFFAPKDAHPLVQTQAHCVTQLPGGMGVAREVADMILSTRGDLATFYELGQKPEFEDPNYLDKLQS